MENSALGTLGKRVVAWIVIGAVFGFVTMIFTLALIAVAIVGVLWALRHL